MAVVNVIPLGDSAPHFRGRNCDCQPQVVYIDPDTGQFYKNGPLITHFAFDGRDAIERLVGGDAGMGQWGTFEDDNPPDPEDSVRMARP